MEHWYALNTKPHREQCVAEQLCQRRLEVYLPLVRVNPVNPRAARERPYFPGYLFARMDLQAVGTGVVQWTPGLRGLVQFGGLPGLVPEAIIVELRRRLAQISAAGGLAFDRLHPGDAVRITGGPLAGYEGIFDLRRPGSDRVRVLLEFMRIAQAPGRSAGRGRAEASQPRRVPVELDAGWVEKISNN